MPRPRQHNVSKVKTITYSYKGVWVDEEPDDDVLPPKLVADRKVAVDVMMHSRIEDKGCANPPFPVKALWFELRCPSVLDGEAKVLSFVGPDIEALRLAMWGALDDKFAVKWDYYYLVEVIIGRPYSSDGGTSVDFSYVGVWKGTAHDGTLLLKSMDGHEYTIKPWPGEFSDNGGKTKACIPATDENRIALESFSGRFKDVGNAMKDMLRPNMIMKTLSSLASVKYLPMPEDTKVGIVVHLEPDSFKRDPLERCFKCYEPTPYWCTEKDVACCRSCAEKVTLPEVPLKTVWIRDVGSKFPSSVTRPYYAN